MITPEDSDAEDQHGPRGQRWTRAVQRFIADRSDRGRWRRRELTYEVTVTRTPRSTDSSLSDAGALKDDDLLTDDVALDPVAL